MLLAFADFSEGVISKPRTFTGGARGLAWFTSRRSRPGTYFP
jgi:hypothetical protein